MSTPKTNKQQAQMVVYPAAQGWTVASTLSGAGVKKVATLEEAAAVLPPGQVTIALRTSRVLVERFTLPSADPAEIEAMTALQLEKTLPFAIEETAVDTTILRLAESSAIAVASVVRTTAVEEEFAPLTSRGIWPEAVILFPAAVASLAPANSTALSIFSEGSEIAFVISEAGKVAFAQTILPNEFTQWDSEIAQLLFAAQIAGVQVNEAVVRLETGLDLLELPVSKAFGRPPERFEILPPFRCAPTQLAPASWSAAKSSKKRAGQLRKQLAIAGAVYLLGILGIVAFLVVLRLRVDQIEKQVKQILPETEQITRSSTRWDTLAPALDPNRQPLEVLLQLYKSRPSDDVLITNYDQTTTDLVVRGEAPALDQALLFLDTIKSKKELPYTLTNEQPQAASDNKFQFQITGGVL